MWAPMPKRDRCSGGRVSAVTGAQEKTFQWMVKAGPGHLDQVTDKGEVTSNPQEEKGSGHPGQRWLKKVSQQSPPVSLMKLALCQDRLP